MGVLSDICRICQTGGCLSASWFGSILTVRRRRLRQRSWIPFGRAGAHARSRFFLNLPPCRWAQIPLHTMQSGSKVVTFMETPEMQKALNKLSWSVVNTVM